MTQEEFDRLPGLLTRRQFCAATGLDTNAVGWLRKANRLRMFEMDFGPKRGAGLGGAGRARSKYYKAQAAELAGFRFGNPVGPWVSVIHELPVAGQTVLVATRSGNWVWLGFYDGAHGVWRVADGGAAELRGVTHWMGLPAAPSRIEG